MLKHNNHNHYNSMVGIAIIRIHKFIVVEHNIPTETKVLAVTLTDQELQRETFKDDFDNSLILINVFIK